MSQRRNVGQALSPSVCRLFEVRQLLPLALRGNSVLR
jgi:hypothetical protein